MHAALDEAGHAVSYSDDAGRYLCNQLFYVALECLQCQSIPIPAGFIHLPLERDYPTPRVIDGLSRIIRILKDPPAGPPA